MPAAAPRWDAREYFGIVTHGFTKGGQGMSRWEGGE
jgi:hypothetical protein